MVIGCSLLTTINGFSAMSAMNDVSLFIFNAIGISIAILSFCSRIFHQGRIDSFFLFFGINSMIVLCTNNLLIEIVRLADFKITGNVLLNNGFWGEFVFWIILVLMEVPMILLFKDKFKKKMI